MHQFHEANFLYLDSSKAQNQLGWKPVWSLETTLEKTTDWYQNFLSNKKTISKAQLTDYIDAAKIAQVAWAST